MPIIQRVFEEETTKRKDLQERLLRREENDVVSGYRVVRVTSYVCSDITTSGQAGLVIVSVFTLLVFLCCVCCAHVRIICLQYTVSKKIN